MTDITTFIDTHSQLLKRMSSYQKDDIYGGVFTNPADQSTCNSLRHEKWKTCHPSGKTNESIPTCTTTMSTDELINYYNQHMLCRNYRAIENHSNCFTTKDKGHIKAQKITLKNALQCATLLSEKTKTNKANPGKKEKQKTTTEPTHTTVDYTPIKDIHSDYIDLPHTQLHLQEPTIMEGKEQTQEQEQGQEIERKPSKKKRLKINQYLYMILSVLSIISIVFLFIRYVL